VRDVCPAADAGAGTPPEATDPRVSEAEQRLFTLAIAPCLTPSTRAVEIGPGDGRWTARLAPLVRELVAIDVSAEMLDRARARIAGAGMTNVSFLLGTGRDLAGVTTESVDLVFGYDVLGQVTLPDTLEYLAEIGRVLQDGGISLLQHDLSDVMPALDRLEHGGASSARQYHGRDALARMYDRFGLRIESIVLDGCAALVLARKPADSVVPRLEQALRMAATARDERALDEAVTSTMAVASDLQLRITSLAKALRESAPGADRIDVIQRVRRLVRG